MQSVKETIKYKEENLKEIKSSFNEVMNKLKKDSKEYSSSYIGHIARRLMCFYFGEYVPYYESSYKFKRMFSLSKAQHWVNTKDKNGFVEDKHYNIYDCGGNRVGFICNHNDIFDAFFSDELHKIWCWYCKDKRYKNSLDDFIKEFKKKQD